jgi:hypothetical protein
MAGKFESLTAPGLELWQLPFNPRYLMPPCIFIPRILEYDMDNTAEENHAQLSLGFYKQVTGKDFPSI